jgi:hypothetical protein
LKIGESPSGKALVSGTSIGGSNPSSPTNNNKTPFNEGVLLLSLFGNEFERTAASGASADGCDSIQRCPGQRRRNEVETRRENRMKLRDC